MSNFENINLEKGKLAMCNKMRKKPIYCLSTKSVRETIDKEIEVYTERRKRQEEKVFNAKLKGRELTLSQYENINKEREFCAIAVEVLRQFSEKLFDGVLGIAAVQYDKARWVGDNLGIWCCSNCEFKVFGYNNSPYCPNCGADMQEDNNE